MVVPAAFAQSTILLANRGKSTSLATFVDWVADPVDASITANLKTKSGVAFRCPNGKLTALC